MISLTEILKCISDFFGKIIELITTIIKNPKETIIVILTVTSGFLWFQLKGKDAKIAELQTTINNTPPPKEQVVIYKDKIKVITTVKDGTTTYVETYVPPEGSVTMTVSDKDKLTSQYNDVIEKMKNAKTPEELAQLKLELTGITDSINKPPEVKIVDKGFCFKPGMGIFYNAKTTDLTWEIDAKFAFYKRYSSMAFITKECAGLSVSRHIDDILPFSPANVEAAIFIGYPWSDNRQVNFTEKINIGLGIRMSF